MKWQKARQFPARDDKLMQHYPNREFWVLPNRYHLDSQTVGPDGLLVNAGDCLRTNIVDSAGNILAVMADTVELLGYDESCFADAVELIEWEEFIR